ncbi:MAG: hypothetical protein RMJ39_01595 [Deltaproteobacteria bacterium]|nr:hypothetical protein [Deltaproteobacteria bacterium]
MLNSFCGSLKGELISKLEIEKNLSFENEQLRTEIATITRERFLTLVAQERLGLKKAKEEDVYVVR